MYNLPVVEQVTKILADKIDAVHAASPGEMVELGTVYGKIRLYASRVEDETDRLRRQRDELFFIADKALPFGTHNLSQQREDEERELMDRLESIHQEIEGEQQ